MSKKNSDVISSSPNALLNQFRGGLMKGAGYDASTLKKKPLIAIANSHTEMTAGHNHLGRLADKVKEGILIEGGEYAEFNVPAPCDGIAMGHDGMRYVLAQRDLIADIVETHVRSQAFDAVVFIAGCDKINPGMMMAMGRLDMPSIYLAGGPGQMNIRNTPTFTSSIDHNDYHDDPEGMAESLTCSTCGACEIMGTANTFQCLAEVLGICLPGSSNIPGWHSDKLKAARATGQRVVQLFHEGLNARQLLTQGALENAATMLMAIGGSTNGTLHLPAIAHSAGAELTLEHFERASAQVPTLLAISPNGPWGLQDLWAAGGMPAVLHVMQKDINTTTKTVDGGTLQDVIDSAVVRNPKVIPARDNPHRPTGGMIAFIEDGDMIELDILNGRIHADVTEDEVARRREGWQPMLKEVGFGFMDRYRRHVRSASEGAILD